MKKLALILFLLICFTPGVSLAATSPQDIHIEWSYDTQPVDGKTLAGYYLYKEKIQVCSTNIPEDKAMDCIIDSEPGTFNFTLTAFYSDGTESPHSPTYEFDLGTVTPPPSPPPVNEGSHSFTFTWETNENTATISGHRIYLNNTPLCESNAPLATEITCNADILSEIMDFTITTLYTDNTESAPSNLLRFDPTQYPQLFNTKLLSFSWDYPAETDLAGFKVYQNNIQICETTNPADRQISCTAEITSPTVTFAIAAVDINSVETTLSNILIYTTDTIDPTPDPTVLQAIITSNSTEGTAPFTVSFDGASSTGDISAFSWSFGDGSTSDINNIDHQYTIPGTYTARLTVSDLSGTTSSATISITVTEGTPALEPPNAVISSSAAVGDAPLNVSFNGEGSTAPNSTISLYHWDFGDGSTATGVNTSHIFTTPGIFSTTLTVTNSDGLTNSTSTPVMVTIPPPAKNQPPQAIFSATPTNGSSPLTVVFNASASSDSDGSVNNYTWQFGDGSSGSGVTTTHTYTNVAAFTASLLITDDDGAQNSANTTITVEPEQATPDFNIELGEISVNSNWAHVEITTSFQTPVVIAGPPGSADPTPCVVRLRNISPTGFDIKITEWDYLDDSHANESISYIIMEKGHFTLQDGTQVEAGTFDGSTSFRQITFNTPFTLNPVVLSTIASNNETDTISGRMRNISKTGFDYYYREQEKNSNTHTTEAVNFIAWEQGSGSIETLLYEAQVTPNSVTNNDSTISFQSDFGTSPLLLADMQTTEGADTSYTRTDELSATGVLVNIQEEQSNDDEVEHTSEVVGYLAIGSSEEPVDSGAGDKLFTFTWDYDLGQDIAGYRFYLNNNLLCETNTPAAQSHSCKASMLNEIMSFTMTAIDNNGAETMPSPLLTLDPAQFPQLAPTKQAVFNWEFNQSQEINITGFLLLINDLSVCETEDPTARQLACEIATPQEDTRFSVKAINTNQTTTEPTNIITYTP